MLLAPRPLLPLLPLLLMRHRPACRRRSLACHRHRAEQRATRVRGRPTTTTTTTAAAAAAGARLLRGPGARAPAVQLLQVHSCEEVRGGLRARRACARAGDGVSAKSGSSMGVVASGLSVDG
jgi:hypothetical protein